MGELYLGSQGYYNLIKRHILLFGSTNCLYIRLLHALNSGDIFVPIYYVIIFPYYTDYTHIQAFSTENSLLLKSIRTGS